MTSKARQSTRNRDTGGPAFDDQHQTTSESADESEPVDTERDQTRVGDGGWALVVTIVLLGAGLAAGSQLLLVAATIPLWFVAVAAFGRTPDSEITVGRRLSFADAAEQSDSMFDDEGNVTASDELSGSPGDTVRVEVGVRNDSDDPVLDLRVADGVPDGLPVSGGTSTVSLALGPGEERTFSYEVELRRGKHEFGTAQLRARNVSDTVVETWETAVGGDAALSCLPTVQDAPADYGANNYAGEVATDDGGSGVEFYSIREYEPGDPVRSIDWRRYANTRELATVEYRAERSTRIVCIVDVRVTQHRAESDDHLSALELSTTATEQTFETLVDAGHPTGVVALDNPWISAVSPGTDAETRTKVRDMLDAVRDIEDRASNYGNQRVGQATSEILHVLPGEAQVFLFSSFVDDLPIEVVEMLRMQGYPVYVVSPDVTGDREDLAARLKGLERRNRLSKAREKGAQILDWDTSRPVGLVLSQAVREVSSK